MNYDPADLPEQVLIRIDLLCEAFEQQWLDGQPASAESFAETAEIAPEHRPALLAELCMLEADLRRDSTVQAPELSLFAARRQILQLEAARAGELSVMIHKEQPQTGAALLEILQQRKRLTPFQAERLRRGGAESLRLGPYVLTEYLGGGGMADVYQAIHQPMQRKVALKIVKEEFRQDEQFLKRFRREAATAARLNHPGLATAYDASECQGVPYLSMELIEGGNLKEVIAEGGPMTLEQARQCVLDVADALRHIHDRGVIHRDIKPSNIMLDSQGRTKVLDVGLAQMLAEKNASVSDTLFELTDKDMMLGTVAFMSPEQAEDPHRVAPRTDIYSLGCTLYFLLHGRPPYSAKKPLDVVYAHLRQPIPDLEIGPSAEAKHLNHVFQKMLAKDPADRHADADALIQDLQPNAQTIGSPPTSAGRFLWKSLVVIGALLLGGATWGLLLLFWS